MYTLLKGIRIVFQSTIMPLSIAISTWLMIISFAHAEVSEDVLTAQTDMTGESSFSTENKKMNDPVIYPENAKCPIADSFFGDRQTVDGRRRAAPHNGIDIPAELGTPVLAIANGTVVNIGQGRQPDGRSGGTFIRINHQPADFGAESSRVETSFFSRYHHLDSKTAVFIGDEVEKGQVVGFVGNHPDRHHLHFVTGKGRKPTNPLFVFSKRIDLKEPESGTVEISYKNNTVIVTKESATIWPLACKSQSND